MLIALGARRAGCFLVIKLVCVGAWRFGKKIALPVSGCCIGRYITCDAPSIFNQMNGAEVVAHWGIEPHMDKWILTDGRIDGNKLGHTGHRQAKAHKKGEKLFHVVFLGKKRGIARGRL